MTSPSTGGMAGVREQGRVVNQGLTSTAFLDDVDMKQMVEYVC